MKTQRSGVWMGVVVAAALVVGGACSDDDASPVSADVEDTATTGDDKPGAVGEFAETACRPPIPRADGFRCGTVAVPVDRSDPESGTIDIAVAVLPAPEPIHEDPVIVVDRFEASIDGYDSVAPLPERVERDVILFDMRGLGRSTPSLACTEVDYRLSFVDTDEEVRSGYLDSIDACRQRLESDGIDPDAYSVEAIAADVVDIRRALGHESWNVVGYGRDGNDPGMAATEVVLQMMRTDANAIRSVTLEAPVAPQLDPWTVQADSLDVALTELVASCAEQPECAQAHPDLEDVLRRGFSGARTEYEQTSGEGDPMTVVFDPAWMSQYVAFGVGSSEFLPGLLPIITAPQEEFSALIAATTTRSAPDNEANHGFLLSVLCRQTGSRKMPADRGADSEFGVMPWGTIAQSDSCERWGAPTPDGALDEPVASDIPMLLLYGQFDPNVRSDSGRLMAEDLEAAHVVDVPSGTAGLLGGSDCARTLRNAFVADPEAELDTSCLSEIEPISFGG